MEAENLAGWPESLIATHSGLRGRPGIDLTVPVVRRVIGSFVTLLEDRGAPPSIAVARDERAEGKYLASIVTEIAKDLGLGVRDLGAVSTPTAKLAARHRELGGAVIVTASHLGPEWNGLKLVSAPNYVPVDLREVLSLPAAGPRPGGRVSSDDTAIGIHADALLGAVDLESIKAAALNVSVSGGVGSLGELVLRKLNCRLDDGSVHVAFRLDPDGDRLALADEAGSALDDEVVLPLVTLALDVRHVVKGADTSRMVDDIVTMRGGSVQVVPPGELHLVEALLCSNAQLAGEGNGGVVVPEVGLARDGLAAAVAILGLLTRTNQPLSSLVAELPRYERRRSTVRCDERNRAVALLESLARAAGVELPLSPEDGVHVLRNGTRGLVRFSATEPLLRVMVESHDATAAEALHAELRSSLGA